MGRYEEIHRILKTLEQSHQTIHCMFIVPEALDANGGPTDPGNKLLKNQLEVWLEISVFTQTEIDAGTWNPSVYDLIVLGGDTTTAWTLANLDDLVTLHVPKICVTSDIAIKLLVGTDGGNTGAQTTVYIDNVMNQSLKDAGIYSVGDQTVLSTPRAIQMLNMSDAGLSEELIAVDVVGSSGDNTKCIVAYTSKFARAGCINLDINADDLSASVMYIGYGKWFADCTTMGKYLFQTLIHLFLHEAISVSLFVREIGATTFTRLFGNMGCDFSNKNPLVEFIAGTNSIGTRNPVGKSWRDIIGTGYLDAGGVFGTDNVAADLLALKALLDAHIIEDESTYNDTTLHEVKANKEYPILEVVLSGGVVTVYNYEWGVGDAGADPSETQARTEITHFSADAFELSKIFVNINKATNGLWTRMAADDKAYMYAKYYDSTASAFVLVPDIVLRDKFVDTLKSALPIDTDLGEGVVFDGAKLQLASRFIIYFYVDDDIDYLVEIPFTFGVRRI